MRKERTVGRIVALTAILTLWPASGRAGGASVTLTAPTVGETVTESGKQREYQRLWPGEPLEVLAAGPFVMVVKVRALAERGGSGSFALRVTMNGATTAEKSFALDGRKGERFTERDKLYLVVPEGEHRYSFEATSGKGIIRLARSKKSKDDPDVGARQLALTGSSGSSATEVISAIPAHAAVGVAGGRTVVVAIAPFKNNSLDPKYDGYAGAVPGQLVAVLSRSARLKVVERDALNQALDEMALAQKGIVDPSTAQELGRVLGAEYLIVGGVAVFDDTIRVSARLVNIATGQAVGKSAVAPDGAELNSAVEDLGAKLVQHITGEELFPERYARRSPWAAGLFSVFPGGGQFYNERYVKGAVVTGFGAASVVSVLVTDKAYRDAYNAYKESRGTESRRDDLFGRAENILLVRNILIGVAVAVEVFSIYDAISEAIQDNEEIDQRLAEQQNNGRPYLAPMPGGVAVGFTTSF